MTAIAQWGNPPESLLAWMFPEPPEDDAPEALAEVEAPDSDAREADAAELAEAAEADETELADAAEADEADMLDMMESGNVV